MLVAFVQDVAGSSPGTRKVRIVWSKCQGRRDVEHVGTAHGDVELAALRQAAWDRINAGMDALDVGLGGGVSAPFRIVSSRTARLWDALERVYRELGVEAALRDRVFRLVALARIVEPTSKREALRLLAQIGVAPPAYSTVKKMLKRCFERGYRDRLEAVCARHEKVDQLTFCLYDVTTLHWETDTPDELRKPGFSKQRRLEPQINVGLLVAPDGFPLLVREFEGNHAETKTIVPVLNAFKEANPGAGVTVVADAGMLSDKNLAALEDAGYTFIVGGRLGAKEPAVTALWRVEHPGQPFADGQLWRVEHHGTKKDPRLWVEHFQYRAARAARDLKGIDKTVTKALKIIDGNASGKRNRFIRAGSEGELSLDGALVEQARLRAGTRSYKTNLKDETARYVIDAYHQLWHVENTFRMAKTDLRARPAFHRNKDRIHAHLTLVTAALAVSKQVEALTGMTIREFVRRLRNVIKVQVEIGGTLITAEHPIPDTALKALQSIHHQ